MVGHKVGSAQRRGRTASRMGVGGSAILRRVSVGSELELTTLSLRRTPMPTAGGKAEIQLVVLLGPAVGQALPVGEGLVLGRATAGIAIHDEGVSRRHAALTRLDDGSYLLRDLGSRNGTYVNGVRVQEVKLALGDRIAIGGQTVLQLTARDNLEDQRVAAQKLQALGELAGGIAHDFNNLLGVVLANVSHVQSMSTWSEAEVRRVLADIEVAARRAGELTHDLMVFARSGPRARDAVELGAVLEDAARLLGAELPESIQLEVEARPGLVVRGDSTRLAQVLTHLGSNAITAMPGGGRLRLSAGRCDAIPPEMAGEQFMIPAGELALIRIEDTGMGMEPAVQRRAFDPFFTTKPRGAGTGLGLATALAIVRDHGGHVGISSTPGVGTQVFVFLPLRRGQPQIERRTVEESAPLSGCVLLADDEDLVRNAARRVLEHAGLRVLAAEDGDVAIRLFEAHRDEIDLVVLDLDMPKVDGERALEAIRASSSTVKVLISSGYIERAREAKLRDVGIDGTLDKPYDSLTLLQAVAGVLRAHPRRAP